MSQTVQLIERARAEDSVRDALAAAAAGAGTALFLTGTAGIGKTTMLGWAAALAGEEGHLVAHAIASQMERGLPFGLLGQAIARARRRRGRRRRRARERGRPVGALLPHAALARRALRGGPGGGRARRPALGDPDSLELLGFLCRRLSGLAGAGDRDAASRAAAGVRRSSASWRRPATRASRRSSRSAASGAGELLARMLGRAPTDDEAGELWRACAGTPLLLEAAARALADGTPLHQLEDPIWRGIDSSRLLRRFADVGGRGFDYVRAGAILGVHFDHETATQLVGRLAERRRRGAHGARPRGGARGPPVGLGGVRAPAVRAGAARRAAGRAAPPPARRGVRARRRAARPRRARRRARRARRARRRSARRRGHGARRRAPRSPRERCAPPRRISSRRCASPARAARRGRPQLRPGARRAGGGGAGARGLRRARRARAGPGDALAGAAAAGARRAARGPAGGGAGAVRRGGRDRARRRGGRRGALRRAADMPRERAGAVGAGHRGARARRCVAERIAGAAAAGASSRATPR